MTDPHSGEPIKGGDIPELSDEEVEARIGAHRVQPPTKARVVGARPERARYASGSTRRRVLWRDSATILIFVILALLGARFLLPGGSPGASPSPGETESVADLTSIPSLDGSFGQTPVPTLGGIVNPSLNLNATPTPPPLITLPPITPRPSPSPSPSPTPGPSHTPRPTPRPTKTPTPTPIKTPTPTPLPPVAGFSCTQEPATFIEDFTDSSSGSITSYLWDFGDGTTSIAQNPTHNYGAIGSYQVNLTVTGPGGQNSQSLPCPVN